MSVKSLDDSWLEVSHDSLQFESEQTSASGAECNVDSDRSPSDIGAHMHTDLNARFLEHLLNRAQDLSSSQASSCNSSTRNGSSRQYVTSRTSLLQERLLMDIDAYGERPSRPDGFNGKIVNNSPLLQLPPEESHVKSASACWSTSGGSLGNCSSDEHLDGEMPVTYVISGGPMSLGAYLLEHIPALLVSHAFSFLLGAAGMLLLLKMTSD